jgi:hypothetical protein
MPLDLRKPTEAAPVMPTLAEKVDTLSVQVVQLVSLLESQMQMPMQSMAQEEEKEMVEFLSP